ncbi:MAG: alpha/beta hydrolase [Pseudomonadota bacterium]
MFALVGCGPALNPSQPVPLAQYGTWHQTPFGTSDLHFVSAGNPDKPLVIFIHGTPGSWSAFRAFLSNPRLQTEVHMLALDRPGFGRSANLGPSPEFAQQAQAVAQLFHQNTTNRRILIVGHSLGGSISYRVALDYPDEIGGVLAISSAIDPDLSKPRWYNYAANFPLVDWFLPDDLSTSNEEMMPLAIELKKMANTLQKIKVPVTIVQGAKDGLVNEKNLNFARSQLVNAELNILHFPERGHFIIWEEHEMMVDEILRMAKNLEPFATGVVGQNKPKNTIQKMGAAE